MLWLSLLFFVLYSLKTLMISYPKIAEYKILNQRLKLCQNVFYVQNKKASKNKT